MLLKFLFKIELGLINNNKRASAERRYRSQKNSPYTDIKSTQGEHFNEFILLRLASQDHFL